MFATLADCAGNVATNEEFGGAVTTVLVARLNVSVGLTGVSVVIPFTVVDVTLAGYDHDVGAMIAFRYDVLWELCTSTAYCVGTLEVSCTIGPIGPGIRVLKDA